MTPKTILIAAALLFATIGSAAAEISLTANCHAAPTHVICARILPAWIKAVKDATKGRVSIRQLARNMAPPPEQLASVQNGVFDIASSQFNGFIAKQVVGPAVSLQPFTGSSNARANSVALWRTWKRFLSSVDEYEGVHLLGLFAAAGADFYSMTDAPILSIADLKRRMWALPGVTAGVVTDAGAATVSGPAVQMTEIVQRGVVDGFVGIPAADVLDLNLTRYATSVTRTSRKIFVPSFSFIISDKAWARIDPADQAAIMAVSGEALAEMAGGMWAEIEAKALAKVETIMKVQAAPPAFEAALEAAAVPYVDRWIAAAEARGFDARAALNFYKATVAELAAQ